MEPSPAQELTGTFLFDIKAETKVNMERKFVMPYIYIDIRIDSFPNVLAKFTIACVFEIQNFETAVTINDQNLYVVLQELDMTLRSAAIATSRGVIYSELRGTHLHNAIMPLVDITNFAQQPAIP